MMFRFLFLYKDTLFIRLKSCAIWEVRTYSPRVEQTFSTPQIYRQLEGPNYWNSKKWQNVWFLENVKYVKVFNHHKLIKHSQENFKHLEFSHILRMRRYKIRWKTIKTQKNIRIFETNSHKSNEIYKGYTLGITWLLIYITSVILKEKLRFIEISSRKNYISVRWF